MSDMRRRVLISHAMDDPEWPEHQVEAVALAIQQTGIRVSLDLWHERDAAKRHLSLDEWRDWMDKSIDAANHILCLVSTLYRELWMRKRDVQGGFGVAFESIRLIDHLYQLKRRSFSRIITLRPEVGGYDCIPRDLALDCPAYRWAADRTILLTHLADAPVASSTELSNGLILDGLHYPDRTEADDSIVSAQVSEVPATADGATLAVDYVADLGELSVVVEAHGIDIPGVTPPAIKVEQEKTVATHPKRVIPPSLGTSGMWPAEDEWRAPIGDFPPPWASAWGDDPYGLWADLTVKGITQRMRWIEPSGPEGFWMGARQAERDAITDEKVRAWANMTESSPKKVVIQQGFWLANTPCTNAFWEAVTGDIASHLRGQIVEPQSTLNKVSWKEVMEVFIAHLAAISELSVGGLLCLPTETQWEYAARAGSLTAYWWGDSWHEEGTGTSVNRFAPNPWGLFGVHGNVWEWCVDIWEQNPYTPDESSYEVTRVVRGGASSDDAGMARSAFRFSFPSVVGFHSQGFRFALMSSRQPEDGPKYS